MARSGTAAIRTLFSCRLHAASVKLVDPVQTAGTLPCPTAASRTTYLECISCGADLIARSCTFVSANRSVTHCWVPTGAGSAPMARNSPAVAAAGLPAS